MGGPGSGRRRGHSSSRHGQQRGLNRIGTLRSGKKAVATKTKNWGTVKITRVPKKSKATDFRNVGKTIRQTGSHYSRAQINRWNRSSPAPKNFRRR